MNSLQAIIDHIELFYNNHLQVKKVGSDFKEQLYNFATQDEKYPIVFVVPVSVTPTENTSEFNFDIYCFDIIQKDRANIITILSDTQQILNDLYVYYMDGNDYAFDVIGTPIFQALNNDLLDYAAGYVMNITLTVNDWTDCAVPLITQQAFISVYSQVIDIDGSLYNSIDFDCNGNTVHTCYSQGGEVNLIDIVNLFNTPAPSPLPVGCANPSTCYCFLDYGTYYDNGDGRIRCDMPTSVYNSLCPGGNLTLYVFQD